LLRLHQTLKRPV